MLRVTRQQHSLKYTHHVQLPEMRQPEWIMKKHGGSTSDYTGLPRDVPGPAPVMRAHMNLWFTDLNPRSNIMMANHDTIAPLNKMLGRSSHHAAAGIWRISKYSETDLTMDQRWKGAKVNAIVNLVDEPFWNTIMYPLDTLRKRSAPHRNYSADVGVRTTTLGELQPDGIPLAIRNNNNNSSNKSSSSVSATPSAHDAMTPLETYNLMTIKTKEHVEAYWKNLAHIISVNRPAVGDLPEAFRSRSIRHAHEAFVKFQDALRSHNFQDSYLIRHLQSTRPKELADVFGVFIEMEANYVNHDFCPRCSLPFATTRYCGEGDQHTPFRTNRGRWAPHKAWGKEWHDVVVRRAEQLWYRATEDPLFGTPHHTQKQAEELLRVYCRTESRAKAIHFLTQLRGSLEYLQGKIKITEAMQKQVDALLDSTPHPHMLTNGFKAQPNGAGAYLLSSVAGGASNASAAVRNTTLPHSPLQFRIDLEMGKLRREQKEQGAIRLPPKGWRINTENIVPYKVGPNGRVTNWRQVKEGIEQSFLAPGCPAESYTSEELREMAYLSTHLATRDERRAALRTAFEAERDAARKEGLIARGSKAVFPTAEYYTVFDTSDEALAPFAKFVSSSGATVAPRYGMPVGAERAQFNNPASVVFSAQNTTYTVDTTDETCKLYGFRHGETVTYTETDGAKARRTVTIIGAETGASSAQPQLLAVDAAASGSNSSIIYHLGYDIADVNARCAGIALANPTAARRAPAVVARLMNSTETFGAGTIIGVRDGQLYVSWDNGVAVSLGTPDAMAAARWVLHPTAKAKAANGSGAAFPAPREPYSWVTPFRNDWSEERLAELQKSPFTRERYVSLIQNKFTPVVKRFGYTQHITQDDFVTKEYKDRLTSKQFFTNPQAFEVVPEANTKSVRFGGKDEVALRLHGLPSADRSELERGWDEVPDATPTEVGAVEQALRDISGRRPGNYIKTAAETASLKLNESWFAPLNLGWRHEAKTQNFLENAADRKTIDGSKNPFGGTMPAYGTTYGVGERIREISEDFAKGFGLGGPQQQSPTADNNHLNTLGFESLNAQTLGVGNVVLRMFNEKLGSHSIYNVASALAVSHSVDPRDLLLSLNEWRHAGRPPSPILRRVLADYLKDDIAKFNEQARIGRADRIDLLGTGGGSGKSGAAAGMINSPAASPWLDVERDAAKADFFLRQRDISSSGGEKGGTDGFVLARVTEVGMRYASGAADEALAAHCAAEVATAFALQLSEAIGRGIPLSSLATSNAQHNKSGFANKAATTLQLIRGDVLKGLLRGAGLGDSVVATIISGLSTATGVVTLTHDFAVPLATVLSWKGPSVAATASSVNPKTDLNTAGGDKKSNGPAKPARRSIAEDMASPAPTAGRFAANPIYNTIMVANEGAALDFAYAAAENMRNAALRREFVEACRGVIPVPAKLTSSSASSSSSLDDATLFYNALYDRYCEGLWVPTLDDAKAMFVAFLKRCSADPRLLVSYFNFKGEGAVAGRGARNTEVSGMNKRRFVNYPFVFENVSVETSQARRASKSLQEYPPSFVFVRPPPSARPRGSSSSPTAEDAAAPAPAAGAESASSSRSAALNLKSSRGTAASTDAASAKSSSSSSSATSSGPAPEQILNQQNYYSADMRQFVVSHEGNDVKMAIADALRAAFPTAAGDNTSRGGKGSSSSAVSAPVAPGAGPGPFASFVSSHEMALKIFLQWCDTVFPLLPSHYATIARYTAVEKRAIDSHASRAKFFETLVLRDSGEEAAERDFRQNAERYWRNVIERRGHEDFEAQQRLQSSSAASASAVGEFGASSGGFERRQSGGASGAPTRNNAVRYEGGNNAGGGNFSRGGGGRGGRGFSGNSGSFRGGRGGGGGRGAGGAGAAFRQGLSSGSGAAPSSGMSRGRGRGSDNRQ